MASGTGSDRTRRRRRKSNLPEFQSYLLEIERLEVDYSLSADTDSRLSHNGLVEHQHFNIWSRLLSLNRFAGREVAVTLIGDREQDILPSRL
ncbi:MAG: hypothetical protein ACMVO3_21385 [Thalassobaculum sp.]